MRVSDIDKPFGRNVSLIISYKFLLFINNKKLMSSVWEMFQGDHVTHDSQFNCNLRYIDIINNVTNDINIVSYMYNQYIKKS